jgi:hypothetical protein
MLYSEYYLSKNNEPNNNFVVWITRVENTVLRKYGFTLLDIPDEDYMLYFENNYSPNDMVKIIHENFFFYK